MSGGAAVSGFGGSGAVFFSGCPLHCVYCQNALISQDGFGAPVTPERLSEIFLELQEQGAYNINLVTPTHYASQLRVAIRRARERGLSLPVVCNTSGYERVATLAGLADDVDIYLSDFRYLEPDSAARYSAAPDYPKVAWAALAEMMRQRGEWHEDAQGHLRQGVILRILLLPGHLAEAKAIVAKVFARYGNRLCYSLMNQYTPLPTLDGRRFPELSRPVLESEYAELVDFALDLGVKRSFMQEGGTVSESFVPAFDLSGVLAAAPLQAAGPGLGK